MVSRVIFYSFYIHFTFLRTCILNFTFSFFTFIFIVPSHFSHYYVLEKLHWLFMSFYKLLVFCRYFLYSETNILLQKSTPICKSFQFQAYFQAAYYNKFFEISVHHLMIMLQIQISNGFYESLRKCCQFINDLPICWWLNVYKLCRVSIMLLKE